MQVKFHQPFYDGDHVLVKAEVDDRSEPIKVIVTAMGEDGSARATALATVNDDSAWLGERRFADNVRLPSIEQRPVPSRELLVPGTALGTLTERLEVRDWSTR